MHAGKILLPIYHRKKKKHLRLIALTSSDTVRARVCAVCLSIYSFCNRNIYNHEPLESLSFLEVKERILYNLSKSIFK